MRALSILVLSLLVLIAGTAAGQGSAGGDRPECVVASATSGLGVYGNNLSVSVQNRCSYEVTCRVSADVNPAVTEVHLAPGGSTDVPVLRESPARVFVARVECPQRAPTLRERGD